MVLLVGATGKIGTRLVGELAARGVRPRAAVRDPEAARARLGGEIDYVQVDLTVPDSIGPALEGVEVAYLANGQTDRQVELETNFIAAAEAAGLPRLVKVSSPAPDRGSPIVFERWHAEIEERLAQSGIPATLLHPNMFMDNLRGSAATVAEGSLYSTAGDARIAWIDPADIAAVAAAVLVDPAHAGKAYSLTGPEAIAYDELAERFSRVLGFPVRHVPIDDEAFRGALTEAGLPGWTVDAFVGMYADGVRPGYFAPLSGDVENVLGRAPRSVDEWIAEHRDAFVPADRTVSVG